MSYYYLLSMMSRIRVRKSTTIITNIIHLICLKQKAHCNKKIKIIVFTKKKGKLEDVENWYEKYAVEVVDNTAAMPQDLTKEEEEDEDDGMNRNLVDLKLT